MERVREESERQQRQLQEAAAKAKRDAEEAAAKAEREIEESQRLQHESERKLALAAVENELCNDNFSESFTSKMNVTAKPEMPRTSRITANNVPVARDPEKGEGSVFLQPDSITRTPVTKVMSSGGNVTFTPHVPLYEPNMTKFAYASDNRGTFDFFTQQQAGFPLTCGLSGAAPLFNPTFNRRHVNNI